MCNEVKYYSADANNMDILNFRHKKKLFKPVMELGESLTFTFNLVLNIQFYKIFKKKTDIY